MTDEQTKIMTLLQRKLLRKRNIKTSLPVSEHNGLVFTEVEGVTVTIGSNGGIDIPAVRTFRDDPLDSSGFGRHTLPQTTRTG